MSRLGWALGVTALVLSFPAAFIVASALPLGYDFRAYWLAAEHVVTGARVYEQLNATLGQPDEFHYLPVVAVPFIATLVMPLDDYYSRRGLNHLSPKMGCIGLSWAWGGMGEYAIVNACATSFSILNSNSTFAKLKSIR